MKEKTRSKKMCLGLAILWTVVAMIWVGLLVLRLIFSQLLTSVLVIVLLLVVAALSVVNCVLWWRRFVKTPKN